jgi:hypothetical protein
MKNNSSVFLRVFFGSSLSLMNNGYDEWIIATGLELPCTKKTKTVPDRMLMQ